MARTIFDLTEFDTRSVSQYDTYDSWTALDKQNDAEASNGYDVVRIPNFFYGMILKADCTIKKFIVAGNSLFLQINSKDRAKLVKTYTVKRCGTETVVERIQSHERKI